MLQHHMDVHRNQTVPVRCGDRCMSFSDRDVEMFYVDRDPAYKDLENDLDEQKERIRAAAHEYFRYKIEEMFVECDDAYLDEIGFDKDVLVEFMEEAFDEYVR